MSLVDIKTLLQRTGIVLMLTVFLATGIPVPASALSAKQNKIYDDAVRWADDKESKACEPSQGGPANLTVGKDFSLGPIDPNNPLPRAVNLVRALMADYRLSAAGAAGIVGNFMHESGGKHVPPDINQGESQGAPPKFKGGYGWAQWTGSRQRSFIDYAIDPKNGYMASENERATDAANYAYLKFELEDYKDMIEALKREKSPENAAVRFENTFERAGVPALDKRRAAAREVFDALTNGSASGAGDTSDSPIASGCSQNGSATITGNTAFPLVINKKGIGNRGIFKNGTTDQAGHPYTAYDILADPGVEVVAFMPGKVTHIGEDKCPGRLISVYNAESNVVISYLHLNTASSTHVKLGQDLALGAHVGQVGPASAGCGTPHLHIDAATGKSRPGCRREDCPAANAAKFVDIGPQLFQGFQALPE